VIKVPFFLLFGRRRRVQQAFEDKWISAIVLDFVGRQWGLKQIFVYGEVAVARLHDTRCLCVDSAS
jgi:hypothetical protein